MLTIIKQPRGNQFDATITLPDSTIVSDVERFCRLAKVFYGHHSPEGHWIFTEMRGRKCLALWKAGFDARWENAKYDRRCISHPRHGKLFSVSQACDMAKVINGEPEAVTVPTATSEDFG